MSKAFTRESDGSAEPPVTRVRSPLPPGVKNYITPEGARRLQEELAALLERKTSGDPQKRESRVQELREIQASLVIAEPPADRDVIRFGATVTLERGGRRETYRLVGLDETDLDANLISWLSPLARALIGKRAGERVRFRAPAGQEDISILTVSYGIPQA